MLAQKCITQDQESGSRCPVQLAEQYARLFHSGQQRKVTGLPFIVHPRNVVDLLGKQGVDDPSILAIAWLHDSIEDTPATYKNVRQIFGPKIADGVYILTRNVSRDVYLDRLGSASDHVRLIKLCDTLDNLKTLDCLAPESVTTKIQDTLFFYIPMALELCPDIAFQMRRCLDNYFKKKLNV